MPSAGLGAVGGALNATTVAAALGLNRTSVTNVTASHRPDSTLDVQFSILPPFNRSGLPDDALAGLLLLNATWLPGATVQRHPGACACVCAAPC